MLRKVLIVEDNPVAGPLLAELLEVLGHEPRLSRDAKSALREVREFQPV